MKTENSRKDGFNYVYQDFKKNCKNDENNGRALRRRLNQPLLLNTRSNHGRIKRKSRR